MFESVTEALSFGDQNNLDQTIFDQFKDDPQLKDALSTIFMNNFDAILDRGLLEDGRVNPTNSDLSPEFEEGYGRFLEGALFSPPLGERAQDLVGFINAEYTEMADDLGALNDADFERKYGQARASVAETLGQLTGVFFEAMDKGLSAIWEDSQKAGEVWEMLFSVVPAVAAEGTSVANPVAGIVAVGVAEIISGYGDDVANAVANGEYEEAVNLLKEQGVDPRELIHDLYDNIHASVLPDVGEVPGHPELDLKGAWQNGYDHIEGAPKFEQPQP